MSAKRALRAARDHLAQKDYGAAIEECQAALSADPACFEAFVYLGKASFMKGSHEQADFAYQSALKLNDKAPPAWQGLAELYTETQQWAKAAEAYQALVDIAHRGDVALAKKLPSLTRRLAEAHLASGQLEEAETALTELLKQYPSPVAHLLHRGPGGGASAPVTPPAGGAASAAAAAAAAALSAAAAAAGPAAAAAAAAAAASDGADEGGLPPDERLSLLCLLADVQLREDAAALDSRVSARVAARAAAAGGDVSKVNEAYERAQAAAEAADEALELDCDHATPTLKEIVMTTAPTEQYARYHDAYLLRLRRAVQVAPPGSMARHQRRVAVLELCRAMMAGATPFDAAAPGRGCASAYAYGTALRLLEIEEEIASAPPSRPLSRNVSGLDMTALASGPLPSLPNGLPSPRAPSGSRTPLAHTFASAAGAPGSFSQPQGSFFGSLSAQNSVTQQLDGAAAAGFFGQAPPSPHVTAGGGGVTASGSAARLCELVANPIAACDEGHQQHPELSAPGTGAELAAAAAQQLPASEQLTPAGSLSLPGAGSLLPRLPPSIPASPLAARFGISGGSGSAAVTPRSVPLSRYGSVELGLGLMGSMGGGQHGLGGGSAAGAQAGGGGGVLARDAEAIAQRLVHAFPWDKTGQAHLAMALRRREAYLPSGAATLRLQCGWGGPLVTDWACTEAAVAAGRDPARQKRRKQGLVTVLTRALAAGAPSTGAFIALAELCLEENRPAAALDAAKHGIKFVFERSRAGHERARHAALMLNLLAAQAMAKTGALEDAAKVFGRLAARVSEGEVAFGEVGLPPVSIRQEAIRGLAHVALKRGDTQEALRLYGELVSKALMGRGTAEHWAFGEYGWLLAESGQVDAGRMQLEAALDTLHRAAPPGAEAAAAEYHYKLGRIYWALGGELRREREYAHAQLLEAAAAEGTQWQGPAFEWLGHYHRLVARDAARARKCYARALAIDPTLAGAGDALCGLLLGEQGTDAPDDAPATAATASDTAIPTTAAAPAGAAPAAPAAARDPALARAVCEEALSRAPLEAGWARARLARLQLEARDCAAAVASFQAAIRGAPEDAGLWEGLGAAYQALGRHSSALKSYERALELQPERLYSLAQAGALLYMAGRYAESADRYRVALSLQPGYAAAQLGLAETLLASARLHARMGAAGAAAAELREGAQQASACARGGSGGHLVTAWKLLGDLLMQHAMVTPGGPPAPAAGGGGAGVGSSEEAAEGEEAAAAAARGLGTQLVAMRAARRAYLRAVHLEPSAAPLWGDLAGSCRREAGLLQQQAAAAAAGAGEEAAAAAEGARARAERLLRGALRLAPADAWLWRQLGAAAADPAVAEYALSRALQLDPKDAMTWVELGRLYSRHGEAGLAQRCYEQARGVEPTAVAVWEAMAATAAGLSVPGAERDAADAAEHAVGLGGGPESWAGFAAGAVRGGRGAEGVVLSCAAKAAAQAPLLLAAHNSYGLACEARGLHADAVRAYCRALALVPMQPDGGATHADAPPYTLHIPVGAAGTAAAAAPAGPAALEAAVKLNLARALARAGCCAEALDSYRALEAAGALAGQPHAWVCYAFAACAAGAGAAAVDAALLAALSEARDAEALHAAVLASLQFAASEGRLEEGFALLLQHGPELALALPRGAGPARVTALWLTLLAAAAAHAEAGGQGSGEDLVGEWAGVLRQWAAGTKGVDSAAIEASLLALAAARAAAAGRRDAALERTAAAVRAAPWVAPLRARLAVAALQAGRRHAAAAARACPPATAAEAEAVARGDALGAHATLLASEAAAAAAALAAATGAQPHASTQTPFPAAAALGGATLAGPCPELFVPAAAAARATGLANATAAAIAEEAAAEAGRLQALLRVAPGSTGVWALLAAVALQRAAATGASAHHRHAALCCRAAARRAAAALQRVAPAPAAAAALHAVRANALSGASESHLHSRLPGTADAARAAADEAVAAAAAATAAAATCEATVRGFAAAAAARARRQVARVLWADGSAADAEAAYREAAAAGDAVSPLELARLLAATGRGAEAGQLLGALRGDTTSSSGDEGDGWPEGLACSTALEEAVVLAGLSDLQGARTAAAAALAEAEGRASGGRAAAAAAHVIAADTALKQARATLPDLAKNLLLQARHHASSAAKLAVGLPGDRGLAPAGTAAALLAATEAERGRADRAVEPLAAAAAAFAAAGGRVPAGVWDLAGGVLGDQTAWHRMVHTDPTCGAAWARLREVSTGVGGGGA